MAVVVCLPWEYSLGRNSFFSLLKCLLFRLRQHMSLWCSWMNLGLLAKECGTDFHSWMQCYRMPLPPTQLFFGLQYWPRTHASGQHLLSGGATSPVWIWATWPGACGSWLSKAEWRSFLSSRCQLPRPTPLPLWVLARPEHLQSLSSCSKASKGTASGKRVPCAQCKTTCQEKLAGHPNAIHQWCYPRGWHGELAAGQPTQTLGARLYQGFLHTMPL